MNVTAKQAHVLKNLHRIVLTHRRGKAWPTLDGEDCRYQLVALGARRIIHWDRWNRPVKIAEPDGIMGHRGWARDPVAAE